MELAAVEQAFGELLAALGDVVVARNHGQPADPPAGSTLALVRRFRARRRRFGHDLRSIDGVGLTGEDARALANMHAALEWVDALEPTPGMGAAGEGPPAEEPDLARARALLYRRYGEAARSIRVGTETLDRLSILARLATEPDAATRRSLFEALAPIWEVVDGGGGGASSYRRLVPETAGRWRVHGSPIEANAVSLGMTPGSLEPALRDILGVWRSVAGAPRLEPWDYWYLAGAAARRLERHVPVEALIDLNDRYLASLGADPAELGITYDVLPRPGRPTIAAAFTIGMGARAAEQPRNGPWTLRPPWVFATYEMGGLGNLVELLHESGHALHVAAVRTRPAFLEWPMADSAFLEATADVLGWDAQEPRWQRHWLGQVAEPREAVLDRYGAVMLDVCWALFEIELYRRPDRRPNDVWTEITSDGLSVVPHPEWSWWAIRGQLIDLPGYMANYALSAITAAAIRARILELRGPWWEGDPGWYRFLAAHLFETGASRPPAELLEAFLGGPVTAEPLLADLRRAS
jgi:hypothetical protein